MTNPINNQQSSINNPRIINWEAVHRRLEAAQEALKKEWAPSAEEKKRILKTRAQVLAREPGKSEPGEAIEIIEFTLSYEKYGVESLYVREVCPLKEYTPVPCTPAFVLGIINLRGEILSILDLRKFFDLPETGLGDLNRIVVFFSGDMVFGVLADVITGVRRVALEVVQPPPPTFTGLRREYLKGVSPDRTAILDAGKILSDPRIVVNEFV
jgi:purine-binding chemotaxis protein CheW